MSNKVDTDEYCGAISSKKFFKECLSVLPATQVQGTYLHLTLILDHKADIPCVISPTYEHTLTTPLPPLELMDNCHYDVCANQADLTAAKKSSCAALAHLTTICSSLGQPINYDYRVEFNCR